MKVKLFLSALLLVSVVVLVVVFSNNESNKLTQFEAIASTTISDSEMNVEEVAVQAHEGEVLQSILHYKSKPNTNLSPDGKYVAITENISEHIVQTYIVDTENNKEVTQKITGSFISWAPDSERILVFLSDSHNDKGRQIYYLTTDGKYDDTGLPVGSISADISSDGEFVYALTKSGTDVSQIYHRDINGKDLLIKDSSNLIFAWLRWAPDESKIAFVSSNLALSSDSQKLHIVDIGGGEKVIEKSTWGAPAWSQDTNKILYSDGKDILEYDSVTENIQNITKGQFVNPIKPFYLESGDRAFIQKIDGQVIYEFDGDFKTYN